MIKEGIHTLLNEKLSGIQKILQNRTSKDRNLSSLFTGGYGEMLLLLRDKQYDSTNHLIELFNAINTNDSCTLCNGLAGLGWFIQHLIDEDFLDKADFDELLLQIDEITYNSAMTFLQQKNHDYLHGAVGIAIYHLDRIEDNPKVKNYLEDIIHGLDDLSERKSGLVYWCENPFYNQEEVELNVVNLSLSHGLAGKIVLFAKLLEKNILKDLSKELLEGSVRFMLKSKNPVDSVSRYPSRVGGNNEAYARLGWCYGDLSISIALWQAGVVLQDEQITIEAIATCMQTIKRKTVKESGAGDMGICHGSAGIAHLYNRMYRYTGLEEFKSSMDYWVQKTLDMATHENGLVGYKSWDVHEKKWENNFSLLDGITGIGLVLDAYENDDDPSWDKCMLLS